MIYSFLQKKTKDKRKHRRDRRGREILTGFELPGFQQKNFWVES